MSESVNATYRNGVFIPEEAMDFPDGSKVLLEIELEKNSSSNTEKETEALRKFLDRASMRIISDNAPAKFTREELHERS